MIYKIILKNFKSNLKNYLLFFFSEVLSVAMIFSIFAIKDILWSWLMNGMMGNYLLNYLILSVSVIVLINVFLMAFSVKYYVKSRLKDYRLFLILGMRKKIILCSMMLEFFVGWIGSVVLGNGIGSIVVKIFKYIITEFYSGSDVSNSVNIETYGYTFLISAVIMLVSISVIFVVIEERGGNSFLSSDDYKEKSVKGKRGIFGSISGVILFGVSIMCLGRPSYNGFNSSGEVTLVGCIIALFLILTFGGSSFLERIKKRRGIYYKKILSLNQFYHRYNSNLMIIFLLLAIQNFSLGDLAVQITDNIPVIPDETYYPYDYVWFARQEDDEFAKELTTEYGGMECAVPVMRVTVIWGEQHFGISEKTYEDITGNFIELSEKEVLFVSQGRVREVTAVEQDMESEKKYYPLYYGKRTGNLVVELHPEALEYFKKDYSVKEIRREPVFGYFGDGWSDNVYVFSDEFFKEKWDTISKDEGEPNSLILINIPHDNQKDFSISLNKYVEKHGIVNTPAFEGEKVLYESAVTKNQKKAENILKIIINLFIMMLLYVGSVFIMGMKTFSDLEVFRRKYVFLSCMGMQRKRLKKSIGKEILNVLNLPLILSYMTCTIFIIRLFVVREMSALEIGTFMKGYGVIVIIYLLLQILSAWCMKSYLVHRVMKEL